MKGRPVEQLVYEHIFPEPRPSDPQHFLAFLHQCLVFEVRLEVHSFYGHLDTHEAKYPGLDYCNPTHRMRLSRWQGHRRLFRAFNALRLTHAEIRQLTKWEGTFWAKERYEREQGVCIPDTASAHMEVWTQGSTTNYSRPAPSAIRLRPLGPGHVDRTLSFHERRPPLGRSLTTSASPAHTASASGPPAPAHATTLPPIAAIDSYGLFTYPTAVPVSSTSSVARTEENDLDGFDFDEASDEEMESIGVALNQRLHAQAAIREAGDTSAVMDEEWEQWFKNAMDSGTLPLWISAARGGQWNAIPDQVQGVLRQMLGGPEVGAFLHDASSNTAPVYAPVAVSAPTSPPARSRVHDRPRRSAHDVLSSRSYRFEPPQPYQHYPAWSRHAFHYRAPTSSVPRGSEASRP